MSRLYDFRDYDKYLALKLSAGVWLIIAYLMRPYIALISAFRMGRGGSKNMPGVDRVKQLLYPDDFSLVLGILATIPVLLFIIAIMKRKPSAGTFIRSLWRHGTHLLGSAAILNIIIVFVPMMTGVISRIHAAGWIQIGVSIVILGYLFTSRRIRDTFADFPVESSK